MRNMRRYILAALTVSGVVVSVMTAFSQMNGQRGMVRANDDGPVMGEVVGSGNGTLVVRNQSGQKKEVSISSKTVFVKESVIDKSRLSIGKNLLVIGRPSSGKVEAEIIRVMDKLPMQRGQEGRGGPLMGEITSLDPLTLRQSSGETTVVGVAEHTRILSEVPAVQADVREGSNVRVIAPMRPGSGSGEALRVILLSDNPGRSSMPAPADRHPSRETGSSSGQASYSRTLLPDISRHRDRGFIYGIWIGRGLFSNEELDRAFRVADNLGITHLKVEFKWDFVEKEKGRFTWNNPNTIDVEHVIKLARKYNISIIPYFDTFMPWAAKTSASPETGACEGPSSGRGRYQSPDPTSYASYVFAVVDKLRKGGVDIGFIELDNETSNNSDGYSNWNCFINMTAKQIKETQNAAYDAVKKSYPDIMISSTTFLFPGMHLGAGSGVVEKDIKRRNSFVKAYFEDSPKPKFDYLGVHEVLSGSGNPFTTWDKKVNAGVTYNFGSYNDAYSIWRSILDKYGYKNTPIFNTESEAVTEGMQDVELLQRAIFARVNSGENHVLGWVLSQLTGSKKFKEKRKEGLRTGIADLSEGYAVAEGYKGYYALMKTLAAYPVYKGKVAGEINSRNPWIEKFGNKKGELLYAAFIPFALGVRSTDSSTSLDFQIGIGREARITRSDLSVKTVRSGSDGRISVKVDEHPVFIEVAEEKGAGR